MIPEIDDMVRCSEKQFATVRKEEAAARKRAIKKV